MVDRKDNILYPQKKHIQSIKQTHYCYFHCIDFGSMMHTLDPTSCGCTSPLYLPFYPCPETYSTRVFNIHLPQVHVVGEGGRVRSNGVLLENGEAVEAEVVVCNADLPYAEKELLPDSVSRSFEVRLPS